MNLGPLYCIKFFSQVPTYIHRYKNVGKNGIFCEYSSANASRNLSSHPFSIEYNTHRNTNTWRRNFHFHTSG